MDEAIFPFPRRPFLAVPRTDLYFPSQGAEAARKTLTRTIDRAEGVGVVMGSAGIGKTLLCMVLAEQFADRFQVAQLASARLCTRRALLQSILYSLGLPYRERDEGELRLSLIDLLTHDDRAGEGLLLLVDEAHLLPMRLLEEVRMITNIVHRGESRVRLLLAGSPALEERFASPKLDSLNQRIVARCYLDAFTAEETGQYVQAQLEAAGAEKAFFTADALVAVYQATDGIPRLINQVCDHALVLATAGGAERIDAGGIEEAWADLQQLPIPWNPSGPVSSVGSHVVEFGGLDEEEGDVALGLSEPDEATGADSIPFPQGEAESEYGAREGIESGETATAAEDFEPVGSIRPEVELVFHEAHDPFSEEFEDEEVVIDHYASLEGDLLRGRPRVQDRSGSPISDWLQPTAADWPVLDTGSRRRPDDASAPAEILVIEDDSPPPRRVERREYRQLFARLRQSS